MSERKPHVVLDSDSRIKKARKIEVLLGAARIDNCRRMLEVGAGSGLISKYFSRILAPSGHVSAVDVVDSRIDGEGYDFLLVAGTDLPFDDAEFDIVITNHVIEHVGARSEQKRHLDEIKRTLKRDGTVYFAVPNRWSLWEAHFRLPLLAWLPQGLADLYVKATGRGTSYDCTPLSRRDAIAVFEACGFRYRDRTLAALQSALHIERPGSLLDNIAQRPLFRHAFHLARPIIPTLVFELRHADAT